MEEKELKALVSLLDDRDSEVYNHVHKRILGLGEAIIPYLELEWETNFDPLLQRRIEDLLHLVQLNVLKQRLFVWLKSEKQDLLEGLWLLNTYQYPDLKIEELQNQLEQLYYEVWLEFKPESNPFDQIKQLSSVIYGRFGFKPNTQNFHAPANSLISKILETRRSNPIGLSVVFMLIAQKLKMPVFGVNLPNLFVLTYKSEYLQFYVNAFNRGLIFSRSDIDKYLSQINLQQNPIFYEPCSNPDILCRATRNLIVSFEKIGEEEKVGELKNLLEIMESGGAKI